MKLNKIYIITDAPIPIGFAPTNRILSYVSGFQQNDIDCEIIIFRKTENYNKIKNINTKGLVGNTVYRYLFNSTAKSKYFLKRRIDNFLGLLRLFFFAFKNFNNKSAIIYYSSYTRYALLLKFCKYFNGFLLLKEESEHPNVYLKNKNIIGKKIFKFLHYEFFDGYLLMTQNLVGYFKEKYPNIFSVHIPMTVDLKRFDISKIKKENYITYIGSLNNKKDGILYLLKAFNSIKNEFGDFKLLICGYSNSQKELEDFNKHINRMGLRDYIIFNEDLKNTDIPKILQKSTVLVLPRPLSLQAENGFPTKLGEYLASGVPTLVTAVGEIPKYLKDGISSYIAKPNDIDSLKNKITKILINPKKANKVGIEGRSIAEIFFNNVTQTKTIINFIKSLY